MIFSLPTHTVALTLFSA